VLGLASSGCGLHVLCACFKFTLEDAVGLTPARLKLLPVCEQWHSSRASTPLLLPVHIVYCVQTLKATAWQDNIPYTQALLVYGARVEVLHNKGETPQQLASTQGHDILAGWLSAVSGWSPLRVAAGCRLHIDVRHALRLGLMDPDIHSPTELMAAVTTANTPPDVLNWGSVMPPPVCASTVRMVVAVSDRVLLAPAFPSRARCDLGRGCVPVLPSAARVQLPNL
jgi:hypothetical protein